MVGGPSRQPSPRMGELCVTLEYAIHSIRITPILTFPRQGGRDKRGVDSGLAWERDLGRLPE